MSIQDFSKVTKYLDIVPARIATESEAVNNPKPFDKYYGLESSRAITKLPGSFIIPARLSPLAIVEASYIVYQYNYSLSEDFSIVNSSQLNNFLTSSLSNCFLCIRYRVDETVYRYQIAGINLDWLYVERYSNHIIKKNFVIEVWKRPLIVASANINADIKVLTSLLINPSTPEQRDDINLEDDPTFVKDELFVALPEAIPTVYDSAGPWLTN